MPTPSRGYVPQLPVETPPPSPSSSSKRRRHSDRRSSLDRVDRLSYRYLAGRETIADEPQVEDAEQRCQVLSGNSVFSCFPQSNTSIPQHQVASFVWNSNLPQFTQSNLVNVYLVDATSAQVVHQWLNETNPFGRAGVVRFPVNDTWFGDRGTQWDGTDIPFPFYWVVTRNDVPIASGTPQPIFNAVQTTFADSVVASMASTSAVAASSRASVSSAIAASLSSESASRAQASLTATPTATPTSGSPGDGNGSGNGNVQGANNGSPFPHWAIAVIVVLGTLALLASGILAFFIIRRVRNRRQSNLSHRSSMGSSTPMMANAQSGNAPQSPLLGTVAGAFAGSQRPTSPDMHDGASTMSRGSDAAPFSGADAAVMADAFRAALRKPNFADQQMDEGEGSDDIGQALAGHREELINRELAEEGRDIRSVSSSRGVKVETLSDKNDTDTIHEPPH